MEAELYIMRCKIDYIDVLKEKLELFCQNYGIEVVTKSVNVMYVSVFEVACSLNISVNIEHGLTGVNRTFAFSIEYPKNI